MLQAKMIRMLELCGYDTNFVSCSIVDIPILKEQFKEEIHPDFKEYVETCLPHYSYEMDLMNFLDAVDLDDENRNFEPGYIISKQGMVCFATEGDGSIFAFCNETGSVLYILPGEYSDNAKKTRSLAAHTWHSLAAFLDHMVAALEGRESWPGGLSPEPHL